MEFLRVKEADVSWVEKIYQNYSTSFPEDERRDEDQFHQLFANPKVQVLVAVDGLLEIGYLILWKLSDCTYLEHFEVFKELRNRGLGSQILHALQKEYPKIILESEPDFQDSIAARRIQFYKRNGFHIVEENYIQPPYGQGKRALNLFLMSNFKVQDKKQCIAELHNVVYKVSPETGKLFEKNAPR